MSERPFSLENFLPIKDLGAKVNFKEDLAPVVERISQVIPSDLLWDMFSSGPTETGGKIIFPYFRVDKLLDVINDNLLLLTKPSSVNNQETFQRRYGNACKHAFRVLLWTEIGFQGLENLAKSSASKNWTLAVGDIPNNELRAQAIMTKGKPMFDKYLTSFALFRQKQGIKDDLFTQYKVEYLLDRFLPPNNSPLANK